MPPPPPLLMPLLPRLSVLLSQVLPVLSPVLPLQTWPSTQRPVLDIYSWHIHVLSVKQSTQPQYSLLLPPQV
jgi:hypothetical protein